MTDPYESSRVPMTSEERDALVRRKRRFWLRAIGLSLAGMIIPPLYGLIAAFVGITAAFAAAGDADQAALHSGVSTSLRATALGLAVSAIAFAAFVAALTRFVMLPKVSGSGPGK